MHKILYEDCLQIIKDNDVEKLRNKSFLITGASGMLGSYIVNVLRVLNSDYDMNIKLLLNVLDKKYLSDEVLNEKNVTIIEQNVCEPFKIDGPVDYIVHAASPASPKIMKDYPFETNAANTIGTYNTLMLAKEKNASGYLFVSSREIYGEPMEGVSVFTEDGLLGQVNPLVPRNWYA